MLYLLKINIIQSPRSLTVMSIKIIMIVTAWMLNIYDYTMNYRGYGTVIGCQGDSTDLKTEILSRITELGFDSLNKLMTATQESAKEK